MEVVVTTGAIGHAKLHANHQHQQTNSQFFRGRMPFLSPNQQCQSTEGKISHSMDLVTPSLPGGIPTLSLTTYSSWLPWGRVAMPLISISIWDCVTVGEILYQNLLGLWTSDWLLGEVMDPELSSWFSHHVGRGVPSAECLFLRTWLSCV